MSDPWEHTDLHPGRLLANIWGALEGLPGCGACQPKKGGFSASMRVMPREKAPKTPMHSTLVMPSQAGHAMPSSARSHRTSTAPDAFGDRSIPPASIRLPGSVSQGLPLSYERRFDVPTTKISSKLTASWTGDGNGSISKPMFDCDGGCGFKANYGEVAAHEFECPHFKNAMRTQTSKQQQRQHQPLSSTVIGHDGQALLIVDSLTPVAAKRSVGSHEAAGKDDTRTETCMTPRQVMLTLPKPTSSRNALDLHSPLLGETRAGAVRPSLKGNNSDTQFFPLFNTAWTSNSRILPAHASPAASLASSASEKVWNAEDSTNLGKLPEQKPQTDTTNLASERRPPANQPHSGRQETVDAPFFPLFPL